MACTLPFSHLQVKGALESLPSVGTVTVEYSDAPLLQDKLGTFCPGRTMTLQFDTAPGDQPLLVVDSSNLTGDGLAVEIKEVIDVGMSLVCVMVIYNCTILFQIECTYNG